MDDDDDDDDHDDDYDDDDENSSAGDQPSTLTVPGSIMVLCCTKSFCLHWVVC